MFNRRSLLQSALTLGAIQAFPGLSLAQSRPLVAAVLQGTWEEAARDAYVPAFRRATNNTQVLLDPMLSFDSIAKINASKANPPIDLMFHDPGPALTAIDQGLVEPFPIEKSAHYKDLIEDAQGPNGPTPFVQAVGLAYNPDVVKKPPTSWQDLWRPEFKGRVGIGNLASTLGVGFLVEIARMNGGSEKDVDPGFKAFERLKPNLSAVAANPAALHALFQQGQIDIAPANFNSVQALKARGVPVEFVVPKEGAIGFKTSVHIVKNTPHLDLALKFIDATLDPDVQAKLMASAFLVVPTNKKVKISGEIARVLAKDTDELKKKLVFQDWPTINQGRAAWIERFNREMRI